MSSPASHTRWKSKFEIPDVDESRKSDGDVHGDVRNGGNGEDDDDNQNSFKCNSTFPAVGALLQDDNYIHCVSTIFTHENWLISTIFSFFTDALASIMCLSDCQ